MENTLKNLLERCLDFYKSALPEQEKTIRELIALSSRKPFRVCIVGEFSRGKSHFLNNLLGTPLLPESALPTTDCVTILRYDENPALLVHTKTTTLELPLNPDTLAYYSGIGEAEEKVKSIDVLCPLPLLKHGMELIDTPGVSDSESDSMADSLEALLGSDAAIVMISAISPLSLTEIDFIQTYLLERAIPLIACAISFLDSIPDDQKETQIEYIASRLHAINPEIKVLLPEQQNLNVDRQKIIMGKEAITDFLKYWETLPTLRLLRQKMIYERLLDNLHASLSLLKAQKNLLEQSYDNAQKIITSSMANLKTGSLITEELKTEFMERFEMLMNYIRSQLDTFTARLLKETEAPDYNEDNFCIAFSQFYNELIEYCVTFLHRDMDKLNATLHERFGVSSDSIEDKEATFAQFPVTRLKEKKKFNTEVIEMAIRKGLAFGDSYARRLPFGPLLWPILKPQISGIINQTRAMLHKMINNDSSMQNEIASNSSRMLKILREQLENIYDEMFEKARKNAQAWLSMQKMNLDKIHNTKNLEKQRNMSESYLLKAYSLREEAETALKVLDRQL